jgi:Lar family restriction alleviation protein
VRLLHVKGAEERALRLKMKPCPHCGAGRARLEPEGMHGEAHENDAVQAGCNRCGCTGPAAYSVKGAVRLWNMRRAPR